MTEQPLRHEEQHGIHRLTMAHGANALDPQLVAALREAFARLAADGAPAVVLASAHPRLFCPGWDLKLLARADRGAVLAFLRDFNTLILEIFSYPGPTAAAIGGHSVAGGCLLSMTCDLRVMAEGRPRQGLSELNLGVPVPGSCMRMIRARLSSPALDHLVFRGEGCTAKKAQDLGVVHRTAAPGETLSVTEIEIAKLASRPRRAFVETKRFLFSETWKEMSEERPGEDQAFVDCWFEDQTHRRIADIAESLSS
jgi:enoyl-CoA hydratase/carnithine racemase